MPLTPLHLGIGLTCKAIAHHRFSFMIFAGTQILMDIEPLLGIIFGWERLHFITHNLSGALLIGTFAMLLGKPTSQFFLKCVKSQNWFIPWHVAAISAYLGSVSHILLDAFIHTDMYPFYPFSVANPLLNTLSHQNIVYLCISTTIFGVMVYFWRIKKKKHA